MAGSHIDYCITLSGRRLVAECACGWQSQPYTDAGRAGAAWDQHVAWTAPGRRAYSRSGRNLVPMDSSK